jgi:hypothetical protein
MQRLRDYPWPGNIRELENVLERVVILVTDSTLEVGPDLLPAAAPPAPPGGPRARMRARPSRSANQPQASCCPAWKPWNAPISSPFSGKPTGSSPVPGAPPRSSASTQAPSGAGSRSSTFRSPAR